MGEPKGLTVKRQEPCAIAVLCFNRPDLAMTIAANTVNSPPIEFKSF